MTRLTSVLSLTFLVLVVRATEIEKNTGKFSGGAECLIQSKKFPSEFLYAVDQFMMGHSLYRTVCLKSLKEVDVFKKITWQIVRADEKKDTFYLKSNNQNEYLCSLISFFDILNRQHELKRLIDPTKVDKENCEWKIETIAGESRDEPSFYVIKNVAHSEPIFADSLTFASALLRRNVYLKHNKPALLSDNYKWTIDC